MLPAPHREPPPPRRLLIAVALVALIGAGCSNPPGATAGGGAAAPTSSAEGAGGGKPAPSPEEMKAIQAKLPEFARCMRENGVTDFPDPGPEGSVVYDGEPDPAVFKAAQDKCQLILPDAGRRP